MYQTYVVQFDESIFTADVIKKAAYTLAAQAAVDIRQAGSNWECVLEFLAPTSEALARDVINNFRIEVLDQDLRARIALETQSARDAILALAFSRTGLQKSD